MGRPDLRPQFQDARKVNSVERRLADTTKARTMLGFDAEIPLREGLHNAIEWWRGARRAAVSTTGMRG